jgi:prepilin-type N-terminal cleavage/methylation domain-containing protein
MKTKNKFKNGFTRLVDFDDVTLSRIENASSKFTTGFTLVEVLVSIAIFSMSILGLLSVMASGIINTTYAKNKIIAGYLAQEGIEYMRNIRDNDVLYPAYDVSNSLPANWSGFTGAMTSCTDGTTNSCGFDGSTTPTNAITFKLCSNESTTHCQLYLTSGSYNDNSSTGTASGFTRRVWMTKPDSGNDNERTIFSEVDWKQGASSFKTVFSENLFNWY